MPNLSAPQKEEIATKAALMVKERGGTPEQAKEAARRAIAGIEGQQVQTDLPTPTPSKERGFNLPLMMGAPNPIGVGLMDESSIVIPKERGLDFQGRRYEGFARPDNPEEMRRALSLGVKGEILPQEQFRMDKIDERDFVTYDDPKTGERLTIPRNRLGPDMGDVSGNADIIGSTVVEGTAATAGGLAGSAVAPGAGTAIGAKSGEVLSAALFEAARLMKARDLGINELTNDEIQNEALKAAGFTLAGGLAGDVVMRGLRRFIGNGYLPEGLEDVDYKALQARIDEMNRQSRDLGGQDFNPTMGQALDDPSLIRAEQEIAQAQGGEVLQDRFAAQRQAVGSQVDRLSGQVNTGAPAAETGRKVSQSIDQRLEGVRTRLDEIGNERQTALANALDDLPADEAVDMGERIQRTLAEGRNQVFKPLEESYRQIDELAPGVSVSIEGLGKFAETEKDILQGNIFQSLTAADQAVVHDILQRAEEGQAIGLSDLQQSISSIRDEIRTIGHVTGGQRYKHLSLLGRVERQLVKARNEALEGMGKQGKELKLFIDKTEREYAAAKEALDRNFVGQLIEPTADGQFKMTSQRTVRALMADPGNARRLRLVIDQYPDLEPVRGDVRRMILSEYRRQVEGATNADKAAQAFMRKNRSLVNEFFQPHEVSQFIDVRSAAQKLARHDKLEKVALDRITARLRGDKFGGKAMDPKNIGKAILGRFGDDQDIDYIMRSLSRTPALEADVKSVLFSEVQKRWQRASIDTGRMEYAIEPMLKDLYDPEFRSSMQRIYGKEFVSGFDTVRNGLRNLAKRGTQAPGVGGFTVEMPEDRTVLTDLMRWAFFPPLSQAGRGFTAAIRFRNKRAVRFFAKALADPKHMERLMALNRVKRNAPLGGFLIGGYLGSEAAILDTAGPEDAD